MRLTGSLIAFALLAGGTSRAVQNQPAVRLDLGSRAEAPAAINAGLSAIEQYVHCKLRILVSRTTSDADFRLLSAVRPTRRYGTVPVTAAAGEKYFLLSEIMAPTRELGGGVTNDLRDLGMPINNITGFAVMMQKSPSGAWSGEVLTIAVN